MFLKNMQVARRINEEAVRSCRYLHPLSQDRIVMDCQTWLLCEENLDYINEECHMMVQREQWQGLFRLDNLL